jgi:gliding motility-associated protein GldC
MKQSEIRFTVELDKDNYPDKIFWRATDAPFEGLAEAKAIMVSVWDATDQGTMRLDLWTKDMLVDDMRVFCLETLIGMTGTLKQATTDEFMVEKLQALCETFRQHLLDEIEKPS